MTKRKEYKATTEKAIFTLQNQVATLEHLQRQDSERFTQWYHHVMKTTDNERVALSKRVATLEGEYKIRFTDDEFESVKQQIVEFALAQCGVHSPAFTQEVCKKVVIK